MDLSNPLLLITLEATVPLLAEQLKRVSFDSLIAEGPNLSQIIAEKGDVLQFRSKKKGESAAAFNAFARAITILSFMPGGVTFMKTHFENHHPDNAPATS